MLLNLYIHTISTWFDNEMKSYTINADAFLHNEFHIKDEGCVYMQISPFLIKRDYKTLQIIPLDGHTPWIHCRWRLFRNYYTFVGKIQEWTS
jgi:hypothetical protein